MTQERTPVSPEAASCTKCGLPLGHNCFGISGVLGVFHAECLPAVERVVVTPIGDLVGKWEGLTAAIRAKMEGK